MRVCEAGQEMEDPCNVKLDTAGCHVTMGVKFREGFSYTDMITGESRTYDIQVPKPTSTRMIGSNQPSIGSAVSTNAPAKSESSPASLMVNGWLQIMVQFILGM